MTKRRQRQRGASAILVAIMLVLLGALGAAMLNTGQIMTVRNQLQNSVDAAALAGARNFNAQISGLDNARLAAQDFASRHVSVKQPVVIDLNPGNAPDGDIVFGHWSFNSRTFARLSPVTDGDARDVNAIMVRASRADDNALPLFFSTFLGTSEATVRAEAIAVGGGPSEGCSFPVAVPECQVVDPNSNELMCNRHLYFGTDQVDTAGFTCLTDGATNTACVRTVLDAGGCTNARIGDAITVANGQNLPPLASRFENLVGQLVTSPIIASVDGEPCAPKFNQAHEIVGFATFRLVQVINDGAEKRLEIEFLCNQGGEDDDVYGGGPIYGTTAPLTRLVR